MLAFETFLVELRRGKDYARSDASAIEYVSLREKVLYPFGSSLSSHRKSFTERIPPENTLNETNNEWMRLNIIYLFPSPHLPRHNHKEQKILIRNLKPLP